MATSNEPRSSAPVRATRLIFEYEADRVRLVTEQPVEIASVNIQTAGAEEVGTFVEVRDTANRTLARVPARHAFSTSVEVFPEQHDQRITRTDLPAASGAFTVVVPMPDQTDHATIVRVAPPPAGAAAGARAAGPEVTDLVSFPLRRTQ